MRMSLRRSSHVMRRRKGGHPNDPFAAAGLLSRRTASKVAGQTRAAPSLDPFCTPRLYAETGRCHSIGIGLAMAAHSTDSPQALVDGSFAGRIYIGRG
jgi:hypothetical protein